jgi:hypothetical protein
MTGQMYAVKVSAIGEVRDAEGNLVSSEPVESTIICTEAEARAILEGNAP